MAALYVSLLLAALCIGTAVPLKCYTCPGATSNIYCMTPTNCSSTDTFCQTIVTSMLGETTIGKYCTDRCYPGSDSTAGLTGNISCCNTDLCNVDGPSDAPTQCYTCTAATSNADCLRPKNCTSADAYCLTDVSTASGKTTIDKTCFPSCTPGSTTILGLTITTSCCNTDLCNVSGAPGVKYSYPALGLPLGFLLVLLRGSVL
ncbi:ly6/PLAUR domain-containing protein 2-like [Xenopus tropicalis]|uniref:Ly6/PLAUR domain-containing protein 2-like n=1 Tax=Xenopus tropicalis TaxID=8364 RepID=A0A8J1JTW0_XENTR|nr:ly6/PLAUR domain-containing protein 2-like [Xenopus tropicalis]